MDEKLIKLSPVAHGLLTNLFAVNSPLQLPVGAAEVILEIRGALEASSSGPAKAS